MWRLAILALAVTMGGTAAAGGGSRGEAEKSVRSRVADRKLPGSVADQLAAPVRAAEEAGLPAEIVADKVLEGLAKGVPPARIAEAAGALTARLEAARAALREAGLPAAEQARRANLELLSLAAQASGPQALAELARASRGAALPSFVAAARQLGELQSRGVDPSRSVPALAALARAGSEPAEIERVPRLLDEYRAEGGDETDSFLDEVRARAEKGRKLDDLIDPFGDRPDPLNRVASEKRGKGTGEAPGLHKPGKSGPEGQPSLERPGRSGSAPGYDKESRGRKEKDCLNGKSKNCK